MMTPSEARAAYNNGEIDAHEAAKQIEDRIDFRQATKSAPDAAIKKMEDAADEWREMAQRQDEAADGQYWRV